jgi:hypothetical protein
MEPVETPDERARRLIQEQPNDPESFDLAVGGAHNVEFWTITWPDAQGTLHNTYFVKGAKAAIKMPGRNTIKISFVVNNELKAVVAEFKVKVEAKLANATVNLSMSTMEEYLDLMLEQKMHRTTVSPLVHLLLLLSCSN